MGKWANPSHDRPDTSFIPARFAKVDGLTLAGLLAIVALGFGLRIFLLPSQSYWGDEVNTVNWVRSSIASIVDLVISTAEPHPPLFYFMLHYWTQLAGESEMATRYLPVFFGTTSVALMFVLGRALFGSRAGLIGALLLATNPLNVLQSRDARMYSVFVCVTLLATILMLLLLRGQADRRRLSLGYAVSLFVGLFVHYYFFLVVAGHGLFMLLLVRGRLRLLRPWLAAWLGVAVAYAPWMLLAGSVLFSYEGFTWSPTRFGADTLALAFWSTLVEFSGAKALAEDWWQPLAATTASGLLVVGLITWARRRPIPALLLSIAFLLPILSIYAASLRRAIFLPKYLIAASPAFLLLIAGVAFMVSTKRRWSSALMALLIVPVLATNGFSLFNSYFDPNLANPDYRGAAHLVQQNVREGDGFVFGHSGVRLQFTYYYGSVPFHYLPPGGVAGNEKELEYALSEMIRVFPRVWFVPYWKSDIDLFVEDWLDRHAYKVQNEFAGKVKVVLYSSPRNEAERALLASPIRFANGFYLDAATVGAPAVEPGDSFNVRLNWRMPEKAGVNLKVSLRLVDDSGNVFGVVDRRVMEQATADWLPGQSTKENRGLMVGPGTPPGDYRMELVLYGEADGREVGYVDQNGQAKSGAIQLGTAQVTRASVPPKVEALPVPKLLQADLNDDVRLLGASIDRSSAKSGEAVTMTAYWQAKRDVSTDYAVAIHAVVAQASGGEAVLPMVGGRYPTTRWRAGEVVRDTYRLVISPKATAGPYTLMLGLVPAKGGQGAPDKPIAIGTVAVKAKERQFALPTPSRSTTADFGGTIRLLGYDLTQSDSPRAARLTLYWQSLQEMPTSYTVFVHLLDGSEKVVGQSDSIPSSGAAPTTGWVAGEVITDRYQVPLRAEAPAGSYALEIGLYDAANGQRLKLANGEDRLILQEVSWR